MEETYLIKSFSKFSIISNTVDPDNITKKLGLFPDKFYRKGDSYIHKKNKGIRFYNLWEISSVPTSIDSEDIYSHFTFIRTRLEDKKEILFKMKQDTTLELIFSLSIETDYADFAFDLLEEDISFYNSIANKISFSVTIKGNF